MYHEATACHVTGDLAEVLMILHNLLVCCRPHSNKPGTLILLKDDLSNSSLYMVKEDRKCFTIALRAVGKVFSMYV